MVGPTGSSLGYGTVAAKAGDTIELFGVGSGPTMPGVPAAQRTRSSLRLFLTAESQNSQPGKWPRRLSFCWRWWRVDYTAISDRNSEVLSATTKAGHNPNQLATVFHSETH
jgi:hypothetical protein